MEGEPDVRTFATYLVFSLTIATALNAANWPQWRGPAGTGVSADTAVPTEWSESRNIAWKAPIGGLGVSSPIVWGDRAFITYQVGASALRGGNHPTFIQGGDARAAGEVPLGGERPSEINDKIQFVVAAYQTSDGKLLWEYKLNADGDLPPVHEKRNLAVSSPVTDGERVYAWFANGQLAAVNTNGKLAWSRHLGKEYKTFDLAWGHASSPALYRDRLLLMCYEDSFAYLLGLDSRTGKELWKVERPAPLKSYSTPLVLETGKGPEVIVNATGGLEAFDPCDGKSLWTFKEETRFAVPMPVIHEGVIYTSRGYRSGPYMAMRAGLRGDVAKDQLLWHVPTGAPYTSSIVYSNGLIFFAQEAGIVSCVEAETGKLVWRERLGGIYSSSPVAAGDRVYLFSETGETIVLRASRKPEVLARNKLDGHVIASPAIAGGRILIRTDRHLIAVANP